MLLLSQNNWRCTVASISLVESRVISIGTLDRFEIGFLKNDDSPLSIPTRILYTELIYLRIKPNGVTDPDPWPGLRCFIPLPSFVPNHLVIKIP